MDTLMRFDKLNEKEIPTVAIIFGRFNPPHIGHVKAWEKASSFENWYVGTNPNTQGAKGKSGKAAENKDPLPFEVKTELMQLMFPQIKGHIVPEQSWWSLCSFVYNKHGKVNLKIVSDPEDGPGFVTAITKSNGKEGRHGYYNFESIELAPAQRLSSATDLRSAIRADDKDAFKRALGIDADIKVRGKDIFDIVKQYLVDGQPVMKESSLSKIVNEKKKVVKGKGGNNKADDFIRDIEVKEDAMNPTVGNYDLDTLQRKVARDLAQMADEAATAKSRREWNNIIHQLSNNTMYQIQDIVGAYEELKAKYSKGGANSRDIDKSRLESGSMLGRVVNEDDLEEGVNDPHIFKAIFLAGGPGSGKSFVANKLLSHTGLRTVNSDEVYEFLLGKAGMEPTPDNIYSPQGQEIRGVAKDKLKKKRGNFIDGRLGLIIDGTGKDVAKVQKEQAKLKELGYDTMMLFVNTSLDVAQQRNKMRARSLPEEQVEAMWKQVQDNIMKFQQLFGAANFHVVDNSGGLEDPDRAENFRKVEKAIEKFVNSPASSFIAKRWIDAEKENRARPAQSPAVTGNNDANRND